MWKGISFQYREWSEKLTERGYMLIMPDNHHLQASPSVFPVASQAMLQPMMTHSGRHAPSRAFSGVGGFFAYPKQP